MAGWKPKSFRPVSGLKAGEMIDFLEKIRPVVSRSTRKLFESLAQMPPRQRLHQAMEEALFVISRHPDLSDPLKQAMNIDSYCSLVEILRIDTLTQADKNVAQSLLCIPERHFLIHFSSRAFRDIGQTDHLKPLD